VFNFAQPTNDVALAMASSASAAWMIVTAAFSITSASPFVTGTRLDNYDHGLERAISNSILCSGSACAIWKAMWSGILQLPA
jgi:hypothetical protein